MNLFALLPAWMTKAELPPWAPVGLLALAVLGGIAFLMLPFALFGLRGRLDLLEAQLDEIQAELRMLATRLPDPPPEQRPRRVVVEPGDGELTRRRNGLGPAQRTPPLQERTEPTLRRPESPERF